jgi:SOS response regulatory protein OraA/RecX
LSDFLARRGFDYEIIREVVARLAADYGADQAADAD